MPMPQVTDRIKEAPATVLRALFAGVGQVLLAVDKVRADVLDHHKKAGAPPEQGRAAAAETGPAARPAGGQSAGNVRVLRDQPAEAATDSGSGTATGAPAEEAAAGTEPEAKPAPARKAPGKPGTARKAAGSGTATAGKAANAKPAATRRTAASRAGTGRASAKPAAAKPATAPATPPAAGAPPAGAATPPLPNYDELTVASLRARMRSMDATRVQALLEYERAHAGRDEVVAMYERRLAKIAGEAG